MRHVYVYICSKYVNILPHVHCHSEGMVAHKTYLTIKSTNKYKIQKNSFIIIHQYIGTTSQYSSTKYSNMSVSARPCHAKI